MARVLDRFLHALETKGYTFVIRTEDGNRIFRKGDRWAILDCPNATLRITGETSLTVDGAEGRLLE